MIDSRDASGGRELGQTLAEPSEAGRLDVPRQTLIRIPLFDLELPDERPDSGSIRLRHRSRE